MPAGREAIPWSQMAAVLVIARLTEPSSELHIAEDWYRTTALEDLLGLPEERVNDDRLYRALDRLLPHKPALEQHLRRRLGELFALEYDLLLYDVTSTYFEGLAARNALAQRGYSRDHRPTCNQVCIALVVTREGMPLGYELFAGNRTDVTTVEEIVAQMEQRYGLAQRIWVMDRGMTSAENLAWLQRTGRRYLIGTARSELRKWAARCSRPRTGARCATESKPSSVPDPRARRPSCCAARWSALRRSRRSTPASRSASNRVSPSSPTGLPTPVARWSAANWNDKLVDYSSVTRALRAAI